MMLQKTKPSSQLLSKNTEKYAAIWCLDKVKTRMADFAAVTLQSRPQRWSIFQSDGMVNVFFQATIDFKKENVSQHLLLQ